jgi:hypothetical protein
MCGLFQKSAAVMAVPAALNWYVSSRLMGVAKKTAGLIIPGISSIPNLFIWCAGIPLYKFTLNEE